MKKTFLKHAIIACTVMCGVLTGCGAKSETEEKTEATVAEITTETTTEATTEATTEEVTEEVTEEKVDYTGMTTLTYIGHAAVKITSKDGTVIYIDPAYKGGDYSDEADYILVTHAHDDHKPREEVKLKADGQLITWNEMLHDGVYETMELGDITVQAVPAANGNHRKEECVGYVITVDGYKFYHAGDTSKLDSMSDLAALEIDYAMFPIDGMYNMGPTEATSVAEMVGAKHSIPIHEYDDPMSGKKKSDKFVPDSKLVLEYGETLIVE